MFDTRSRLMFGRRQDEERYTNDERDEVAASARASQRQILQRVSYIDCLLSLTVYHKLVVTVGIGAPMTIFAPFKTSL